MVSRFYRQLSLFLVVIVATSWLVIGEGITPIPVAKAQVQTQASLGGTNINLTYPYKMDYQLNVTRSATQTGMLIFRWLKIDDTTVNGQPHVAGPHWDFRVEYLSSNVTMSESLCKSATGWRSVVNTGENPVIGTNLRKIEAPNLLATLASPTYFRLTARFGSVVNGLTSSIPLACTTGPITSTTLTPAAPITSGASASGSTTVTTSRVNNTCASDYDASKSAAVNLFNKPVYNISSLPSYQHICFTFSNGSLVHKFRYDSVYYEQLYKPNALEVYGGCSALNVPCSDSPGTFNYFSYLDKVNQKKEVPFSDVTGVSGGTGGGGATTSYADETRRSTTKVTAYQFDPSLTVPSITGADIKSKIFIIAYNEEIIYGFYELQNEDRLAMPTAEARNADRLKDFSQSSLANSLLVRSADTKAGLDFQFIEAVNPIHYMAASGKDQARPQNHYVSLVNTSPPYCALGKTCDLVGNVTEAQRVIKVRAAALGIFGQISNLITTSLSGSGTSTTTPEDFTITGGDIDLVDDPAATGPAPDTAPVLKIGNAHTGLPNDVVFKLTHALRVSTTTFEVQNNYFIFSLDERTGDATKKILTEQGLTKDRFYVAVDVAGNIGIIVENKTLRGGIFSGAKDRLDDFLVVGKFSGDTYSTSENKATPPQKLSVNLEQYRRTITKRVYNEPNIPPVDSADCQAEPTVDYPEVNTGYEKTENVSTFKYGIPIGKYRKCLHINEATGGQSWLAKWGITDVKLDAPVDDCGKSLGGASGFGKMIGNAVCWVLSGLISGGVWLAAFAIDFMLATLDLQ